MVKKHKLKTIIVDGDEGEGMSNFANRFASLIDPDFNKDDMITQKKDNRWKRLRDRHG
jgi:hypothetical protein